jgi:phosphoglycerate dehydrogenase-like enzyme
MSDGSSAARTVVMITSPLEPEFADQIASAFPDEIELIYRPDLMPKSRYKADHGDPAWRLYGEDQEAWHRLLGRAEVLLDFPARESVPFPQLCPNVRWVQTTSAGVGPLVRDLGLQDSDLLVTTASGIHAQPLAEFVFAALLFHSKELGRLQEEQRRHQWHRFCGEELAGKTLAIIGPGRIGREVARLGAAFRMRVVALGSANPDRGGRERATGIDRYFARADLHEMLAEADCLVLCAPHTPDTEGLIDEPALGALKRGAVFVNIGRGVLVDEAALLAALRDGQVGFAALDVFQEEPLPPASPFWDMPNVLINPHSASTVSSENAKLTDRFIDNLRHYLARDFDQLAPVLDKRRLY